MVSNKYKQLYECRLPAQAIRFHQDPAYEPDFQGYTGPDIPDMLKPMNKAPCLVKVGAETSVCLRLLISVILLSNAQLVHQ